VTVAEFKWALKKGTGPGAQWRKAEFHVHAPASSDYQYREADSVAKLGEALKSQELSFAVILKHEAFPSREELTALNAHCPNSKLIPGAEINVFVDAISKKVNKDYFFHCILAVDPESDGDYRYILNKAQERFSHRSGSYPAGFTSSILDLGRFFREEGALFIPAHLHQGKSAENSRSIDDIYGDEAFLGFVRDGAFDALEVRDPTTARFFDGRQKTKDGLEIPHSICVASSDAHHHEHIASRGRTTWVRVEDNTYRELTAALSFRHRVALSRPVESHPRIIGVHIVGSFIPDAWVSLNEGLNALIGGKGAGKTALLECLRFVLNTPVPKERAESVNRHIDHVLGPSGYVECLVKRDDGTESLLTRRADSRDRISVTDFSDSINWRNASDGPPFPISILGWHEIEAVADRAQARVELVDRVGDPSVVRTAHEKIKEQSERARDRVPLLQRQIKKLDAGLKELWEL